MKPRTAAIVPSLSFVLGCTYTVPRNVSQTPAGPSDAAGLEAFVFGHFGGLSTRTLETNALPYKLVMTALLMDAESSSGSGRRFDRTDLPSILRSFGFLGADRIVNWKGPPLTSRERPLGMVSGIVKGPLPFMRTDASNIGCAACHAGTGYDRTGHPTLEPWVGLPNTSLDLNAFSTAVYRSLQTHARQHPDSLLRRMETLFPEMSAAERFTMRRVLMGRVRKRLAELEHTPRPPRGYSLGGPGRTNGVGALKFQLGLLDPAGDNHEYAFNSIPDLSGRNLRSSVLADGVYSALGREHFEPRSQDHPRASDVFSHARVVGFFTVSTMGMRPEDAAQHLTEFRDVVSWLHNRYEPPAFPGEIDAHAAKVGARIFTDRCAECHGNYAEGTLPRRLIAFPNELVLQEELGTDSIRWAAVDSTFLSRLDQTAYRQHVSARRTGGYVAPILSGVWATAPYLHNGSVPTLWQLMNPAERPTRFLVGGHRLSWKDLGIDGQLDADGVYRYPAGYAPWSVPEVYDTRHPGLSNAGHTYQFEGLSASDKRALIEYLKGF